MEGFCSLLAVGQFLAVCLQFLAMHVQLSALNIIAEFPQSECVRE